MKKLTLLLALLISISTFAQWTPDTFVNTLVADTESGDMQTIGTSEGETYIVFWKTVSPPANYELRLQKLDVDGNKVFGNDGMLISNTIPMSTYTLSWSISIDSDDNIFVGVTGSDDGSGRIFKVDTEGNLLWSSNGITISGIAYNVTILPLENGEILASWIPGNKALIQKFDVDGNSIWANPVEISSGTSKTAPGNFHELADGGFIAVFHTYSYGISSTLYAQRYDSDGVPQWASPTKISNTATVYNTTYSGAQDGDIVYLGYKGSVGNRFDSYLQRINPDGTLPWGINGMDFDINQTNYEMDTRIAFSPGTQYVWSICSYTDPNQSIYGEYIQKFDKETGAREFTDNAKMIYGLSNDSKVHASNLYLVENQPFFLIKTGEDNGATPITLSVVLLDSNGDFAWPEESKPIATYPANKSRTALTKTVNGQSVAVFIEDKSDGDKIYAQNFIQETDLPAQTLLTSPENGATELPLENNFSWETALNAETYTIQISEDNYFSNIIFEENDITYTNIDITLPDDNTTYFWRVMASNSAGDGEWSEVWNLKTKLETGIVDNSITANFMIYPNPANDIVTISNSSAFNKIQLFNQVGQLVKSTETIDNKITIELTDLAKGVYFIKIFSNRDSVTKKLVIE